MLLFPMIHPLHESGPGTSGFRFFRLTTILSTLLSLRLALSLVIMLFTRIDGNVMVEVDVGVKAKAGTGTFPTLVELTEDIPNPNLISFALPSSSRI